MRSAKMDVEAPAARRWEADASHHAHAPAENAASPPGFTTAPKRSPPPSAAACGRPGGRRRAARLDPTIARGAGERDAPFGRRASSHLTYCPNAGAIVAFMLVFLGWYEVLVVPRLERMRRESVNKERCDYAATTLLLTGCSTSSPRDCFCRAGSARRARAGGGQAPGLRRGPEGHVAQRRVGAGPGGSYRS